jgi:hypothetical protein
MLKMEGENRAATPLDRFREHNIGMELANRS